MLTTLEIPDHILKQAKYRAMAAGLPLKTVVAKALQSGLAEPAAKSRVNQVQLALKKLRNLGRVRWIGPPEMSPWEDESARNS